MTTTQNQIGATTSYGNIWMNTGSWTGVPSFSITTSYKELTALGTNFTLMSPSKDFAMTTDGRLKYTGLNTRNFLIRSFLDSDSSLDSTVAVYKNGSLITGAEFYCTNVSTISNGTQTSLSTNDYLSIFVKASSASTINIYQVTLTAKSIL